MKFHFSSLSRFHLDTLIHSEQQFTPQMNFDNIHVSLDKVYFQSQNEVKVIS